MKRRNSHRISSIDANILRSNIISSFIMTSFHIKSRIKSGIMVLEVYHPPFMAVPRIFYHIRAKMDPHEISHSYKRLFLNFMDRFITIAIRFVTGVSFTTNFPDS